MKTTGLMAGVALGCAMAVTATAAPGTAPTLKIGDPAPALEVMTWIKGEPVTAFEPGRVYVVEFWATWCGPCNAAMPHLSELQQQHADRLTVIGVDVRETIKGEASVEAVRRFVEKKGARMAYTVAMDDPVTEPMFNNWMTAAGSHGLPTSFVVDGRGILVWMGHPMGEGIAAFDRAVVAAVAGKTGDLQAARERQEQISTLNARRLREQALLQPLIEAQQRQDDAAVVAQAERLMDTEPRLTARLYVAKLSALLRMDEAAALRFASTQAADDAFRRRMGATNDARYWSNVGALIAQQPDLSRSTYQLARGYIQDVVSAGGTDFNSWIYLAKLHAWLDEPARALAAQEKAIAITTASQREYPPEFLSGLERARVEYQGMVSNAGRD